MKKGFSFIELIFVVVIVGILTAIAYPNYTQILLKSRRLDAQTALLALANDLEQWHTKEQTYGTAVSVFSNRVSPNGWYVLSIIEANADSYCLAASPQASQVQDTRCQTFTLTSHGSEGISDGPLGPPHGNAQQCWH